MKTKFLRKVISFVCVISLILSVFVASFATGVSAATVDITLNNNGIVGMDTLEAGAALANPTSDIEGNVFQGWYTDTTWATKVDAVPETATTLYAKWTKTVIDFNNMTANDLKVTATTKSLADGVATVRLRTNHYFNLPAYDATGTEAYVVKSGKDYKVTLYYKSKAVNHSANTRYLYIGLDDGTTKTSLGNVCKLPSEDMADFDSASYTFTANVDGKIYLNNNLYDSGDISFNKIIIEEVAPSYKFNSNGVITERSDLVPGGALPTPTENGNTFLGWYTDTTWTTKVNTVPDQMCTLYAKWTKTVIDFNNIKTGDIITNVTGRGVGSGVMYSTIRANKYTLLPAYDVAGAGAFEFSADKDYVVTVYHYGVNGASGNKEGVTLSLSAFDSANLSLNLETKFTLGVYNISNTTENNYAPLSANVTGYSGKLSIVDTTYGGGFTYFDKIVIEEVVSGGGSGEGGSGEGGSGEGGSGEGGGVTPPPGGEDPVVIKLNNNGTVTTLTGSTLPTPTSDFDGNKFLGWYTDTSWSTKVTKVPTASTTLYAKWATTVIDFNTIKGVDLINSGIVKEVKDGVAMVTLRHNVNIILPAYDATGVGAYKFVDGAYYKITVTYKSEMAYHNVAQNAYRYLSWGFTDGTNSTAVSSLFKLPDADMEEFDTFTISFTADINEGKDMIYFINNAFDKGKIWFDKIVIEEVTTPVITLNNNGALDVRFDLEEGKKLPTPTSDIEGNKFLGWYTDSTWATKVTKVPSTSSTLYAKWSKTVIDFNNITGGTLDALATATHSVSGGVATVRLRANHRFVLPAYDAADTGAYLLTDGNQYKVTVYYKSKAVNQSGVERYIGWGATDGVTPTPNNKFATLPAEDMEDFASAEFSFTATTADGNKIYIDNNMYYDGDLEIDKIIIDDITMSTTGQDNSTPPPSGDGEGGSDEGGSTPDPNVFTITLNNNGIVEYKTNLVAGTALPTPKSDIAGNTFEGWYKDTTWKTKVDKVPTKSTVLYAKWSKTEIDFNVFGADDLANFATSILREVRDGVIKFRLRASNASFTLPAYDATGVGEYVFKSGNSYKVTLVYKSQAGAHGTTPATERYLQWYATDGATNEDGGELRSADVNIVRLPNQDMEEFDTVSFTIENFALPTGGDAGKVVIKNNAYANGEFSLDKILIEDLGNVQGDGTGSDDEGGSDEGDDEGDASAINMQLYAQIPSLLNGKLASIIPAPSIAKNGDLVFTPSSNNDLALGERSVQYMTVIKGTNATNISYIQLEAGKTYTVSATYKVLTDNDSTSAFGIGLADTVTTWGKTNIVTYNATKGATDYETITAVIDGTEYAGKYLRIAFKGAGNEIALKQITLTTGTVSDEGGAGDGEGGNTEVLDPEAVNMKLYGLYPSTFFKGYASEALRSGSHISEETGKMVFIPTSSNSVAVGLRTCQYVTILKGTNDKNASVFQLKKGDVYNVSVTYRVLTDDPTGTSVGIGVGEAITGWTRTEIISVSNTTGKTDYITISATISGDDYKDQYIRLGLCGPDTMVSIESVSVDLVKDSKHNAGVVFDTKGGNPVKAILANKGDTIKLPTATKEKYVLAGWFYTDENGNEVQFKETDKLKEGVTTLYAKWNLAPGYVRLRFYTNAGPIEEFIGKPGEEYTIPANPEATGYKFLGWYSDRALKTEFKDTKKFPKASTDVFAKWNDPPVVVDFETAYDKTTAGSFSNRFSIDTETYKTKTLLYDINQGTNNQASTKARVILYTTAGSIPLIEGNTYKVTFKARGTGTASLSMFTCSESNTWGNYKQQDATVTVDATEDWKEYTLEFVASFADNTTKDNNFLAIGVSGNGPNYFDDFTVEGVENAKNLYGTVVRFNTNGGDKLGSVAGDPNDEMKLPNPVRSGYKFLGWFIDKELTQPLTQKYFGETGMTVYAKWQIGKFTEDFEEYPNNIKALGIAGGYDIFTPGTAGDKSNLHGGASSLFRDGEKAGAKAFTLHRSEDLQLTPGCVYTITLWVKPTEVQDTEGTINLISMTSFTGIAAPTNTALITTVGSLTVGEWNKVTYTYTCPTDATFIGISTSANNDMYFDDITVQLNGYTGTATGDNTINPIIVMAMIVLAAGAVLVTSKKVFCK